MNLVERFIQISDWPVSRKTALLAAGGAIMQPGTWIMARRAAAKTSAVDVQVLDALMGFWMASTVLLLFLGIVTDRLRREGVWLGYLMFCLFAAWITAMIYLTGVWSSPTLASLPIAVVTFILFYGDYKLGAMALSLSCLFIAAIWTLQVLGVQPSVLLLKDASAADFSYWARVSAAGMLAFFLFCALLSLLVVAAGTRLKQRLQRAQQLIRRYVPAQLADQIMSGNYQPDAKSERRNLTLFFSDVEGFTNASDELDPEQLAVLLNEYLSEMAEIADRHGATLNQFVGDGIMIFFGAPTATNDKDHALRAVRMSLAMQCRMAELQQVWFKRGFQRPFRIRIGINTGYASVGDYGSRGRAVYSAIGLQTNLAARIQAQCEPGRILISHSTWALVHEEIPCEPKAEIQVKGIHYPVKVYEVVAVA